MQVKVALDMCIIECILFLYFYLWFFSSLCRWCNLL